jgi:putative transposase
MEPQRVHKTYKYRLYPTPDQERALETILWRCRTLSNVALEERKTAWERCGVSLNYSQQANELPDLKAACPEYSEVHSQVLQDVLKRLERTYQAFFRRIRDGGQPGHPRYKGRNRYRSFTYPQYGNGTTMDGGILSLSRIGRIPLKAHRPIEGTPKTVTIRREADGWYVAISCADIPVHPLPVTGQEVGIDMGLESFATLANGQRIFTPSYYRKAEAYLRRCARRVARRQKGSQRRAKAVVLLAKAHQHIANQRRDFHHQEAVKLVRAYDSIAYEELQTANMVRNHHLAKSISNAGWAAFLTILSDKAACAGREVIAVHPAFTSQICSGCGVIVHKSLSVRWHACPECGTSLHRDVNAAKNRERLGQSLRGGVAVAASENRESVGL